MTRRILALGAVFLLGVFFVPMAQAQTPGQCKPSEMTRTGGTAWTYWGARKKARDAWRQKAQEQYGYQWSSWTRSKGKKYSCWKVGNKKRCKAISRPCYTALPVVTTAVAKKCKKYVIQATGPARRTLMAAKSAARRAWKRRVRSYYGPAWSLWLPSNNKDYKCKTVDGKYVCRAGAIPCKLP